MLAVEAQEPHERARDRVAGAVRAAAGRVLLAALTCVLLAAAPAVAAPAWLPPVGLSAAGEAAYGPQVAVDPQGNAITIWERFNGFNQIVRSAARPAGGSWQTPVDVSVGGEDASGAQFVVDRQGNAIAVWRRSDGSSFVVQAAVRPAGGDWRAPVDLSSSDHDARDPHVAVDAQGNASAVWHRSDGVGRVVQGATRRAGGAWQAPVNLSVAAQDALNPRVAFDQAGNAVAVWELRVDAGTVVQGAARSVGGAWQAPVDLSAAGEDASGVELAVGSQGDAIAVWTRLDGATGVVRRAVRPAGAAWQAPVDLSAAGHDASGARVSFGQAGNAVAVWTRFDGTSNVVQGAVRAVGGAWQAPADLSAVGEDSSGVQFVAAPQGTSIVVWTRSDGTNQVVQGAVRPAGGPWQAPVNLSAAGQNASGAQVAVDPQGNAVAVWTRFDGASQHAVQGAVRPAGGAWQMPAVDVSAAGVETSGARVTVDPDGNAVAVWQAHDGNDIVQGAGYDAAPPLLRSLSVPATGVTGQSLTFSVSPFDVWSLGATSWTFGDGMTAIGTTVTHTYAHEGSFTVGVTSADAVSNSTSATRPISITPGAPGPPVSPPPPPPPPSPSVPGPPPPSAPAAHTLPPPGEPLGPPARLPSRSTAVLAGLRLSPSTLRAPQSGAPAQAAAARTAVSYTLDRAASVRFTIQRSSHGRRVGRRCVAPTAANRTRMGCTRFVTVRGSFTRGRPAGADRFTFIARMAGRALKPGRYRLVATPSAEGRSGLPTRAHFRVVRAR